jgi:hypothetical protein
VEVRCEMLAMKEWHRESSQALYSRCCVLDAPPNIPDGEYMVFFDQHRVTAVRQGGLWLPQDHAERMPDEERLREDGSFRLEEAVEILPLLKGEAA